MQPCTWSSQQVRWRSMLAEAPAALLLARELLVALFVKPQIMAIWRVSQGFGRGGSATLA